MRLTMGERQTVTKAFTAGYRKARKKEKGAILDRFVQATGYNRRYAAWLLRTHGKRVETGRGTVLVADVTPRRKRDRKRLYGAEVLGPLREVWILLDFLSGKRLVPAIREVVPILEAHGEIFLDPPVREKLMRLSPATADRLLKGEKRKYALKRRGLTKPGTLLKHQIPIRTFSDWSDSRPGFVEVDLVAHEGGLASGDFCCTLDMVDVATSWTEQAAVKNKAEVWVFEAITGVRERLPFPLLGLDSDNGSEFINNHLKRYCEAQGITFTRSRPYRKNDTCYVEQKNWSVVRRFVGYPRYETDRHLALLNELYRVLRLYTNFFLPTLRLREKVRDGAKVSRRYEAPLTPYRRVLASPDVPGSTKRTLQQIYATLNPAQLHRQVVTIQSKLMKSVDERAKWKSRRHRAVEGAAPDGKAFGFPTGAWKTPSGFPTPPTAPTTRDTNRISD